MRTWRRVEHATICGLHPEHELRRGDAVQIIEIEGVTRKLQRCALCADGLPPPDLPELVSHQTTKPMVPLKRALPRDFKIAQFNND